MLKAHSAAPTCEIVTIGSELLLGQIVDTNTAYLARALAEIGVAPRFRTSVGDSLEEICQVLGGAVERCDMVITTGGLGPTLDDLTREAVAQVVEAELEFQPDLLRRIEKYFERTGYKMPQNNRRQAYVPAGSRIVLNPVGTAPCFIAETGGKPVICLPGVPRELSYLWERDISTWIRRRFQLLDQKVSCRVLKVVGLGESRVDRLIGDYMGTGKNPEVGLLASSGEIKVRITATATGDSQAEALFRPVEQAIRNRLGNKIYGVDEETLEGVIDAMLLEKGLTLAVVETFTAGLAAQRLHRIPSPRLLDSRVIPDRERVLSFLGKSGGSLNNETALALARKMKDTAAVDLALAIVGDRETGGQDSGIHGFSAVAGDGVETRFAWQMGGDFPVLQERGAVIGLNTLRLALLDAP